MDRIPIIRTCTWTTWLVVSSVSASSVISFTLFPSTVAQSAEDDFSGVVKGAVDDPFVQRRIQIVNVQNPEISNIEALIFGADVSAAKEQLELTVVNAIDEACRGYDLPDQIRHRIELAAQSDKVRLLREIKSLQAQAEKSKGDAGEQQAVVYAANGLRSRRIRLLNQNSFFAKSKKTILAQVPSLNPELTIDKLKRSRHRSNLEEAIRALDGSTEMTAHQRLQFMDLVFEETLPEEPFEFFDLLLVKYRIGMLPREKLRPLFEPKQWPHASTILGRFQENGRYLMKEGVIKGEMAPPRTPGDRAPGDARVVKVVRPAPRAAMVERERQQPEAGLKPAAIKLDPAHLLTRHRANVDAAVRAVERQVKLRPEQRAAVTELLLKEIPPPRTFGNFDDLVVQYSFSQLSDDQLKPLFDDDQWPKVLQEFARIDQFRPMLIVHGLIGRISIRQFPEGPEKTLAVLQPADALSPSNQGQD